VGDLRVMGVRVVKVGVANFLLIRVGVANFFRVGVAKVCGRFVAVKKGVANFFGSIRDQYISVKFFENNTFQLKFLF